MSRKVQHVFLIGAKNLGAYGGFETFVNKLTEYHQGKLNLKYHVACKANAQGRMDETGLVGVREIKYRKDGTVSEFTYHNAHCFKICVPDIGAAQAIWYDLAALWECCRYIEEHQIQNPVVYIMACRIGPFIGYFCRKIHKLGGKIYINPDGHEWMRTKWNRFIRMYWKISEKLMVCKADLVVCDSLNIEKYIQNTYACVAPKGLKTTYIAYGAETRKSNLPDNNTKFATWLNEKGLKPNEYYLVIGRFVPENNYRTMIREFMDSSSEKKLVIITDVNEKFYSQLEEAIHFSVDDRIRFVGSVYDPELLPQIREHAYGYIHGHEVGGTNPSLLEALGATKVNLLLDVCFNREVAEEAAQYWSKETGNLAALIDACDILSATERETLGVMAKKRIEDHFSWQFIADQYEKIFCAE